MSTAAAPKLTDLEIALQAVSATKEVMDGMAVFRGTRVPIDNVLGSLDEGTSFARIKNSYSFLTEELVSAARIYARLFPNRERGRSIAEAHPDWKIKSRKILRAAGNGDPPSHR